MGEDDLIRVVKAKEGGITVKEIVQGLKSWLGKNTERNKERMRQLMRQCLDQDKVSKILTLKDSYKDWKDPKEGSMVE